MSKPSSPTAWTSMARSISHAVSRSTARWLAVAGLAALIMVPSVAPVRAEALRTLPTELYPAPLSATAASKLDPRLVMALRGPTVPKR